MEWITNKAITLVSLSFLLAVFGLLSREKGAERVKLVSGIIITVFMINSVLPIVKTFMEYDFSSFGDLEITDTETGNESVIIQATATEICKNIKILVSGRFNIPDEAYSVSVNIENVSDTTYTLTNVTIKFKECQKDDWCVTEGLAHEIAVYVSDAVAAPCTVLLDELG